MDTTARRRLGARTAAKSCGLHPSPASATCHVAVMARGLGDGPVVCYVFHLASSSSGRSRALRGTRGRAGDSGPKRSHSPEGQHRQMLALKFLTSASCCWGQSDQTSRFKSSQHADPAPWGQSLDEAGPDHGSAPVLVVERHGESCRPPHGTEPHREITPSVDRLGSRPPTAVAVTATSPQRATARSGPGDSGPVTIRTPVLCGYGRTDAVLVQPCPPPRQVDAPHRISAQRPWPSTHPSAALAGTGPGRTSPPTPCRESPLASRPCQRGLVAPCLRSRSSSPILTSPRTSRGPHPTPHASTSSAWACSTLGFGAGPPNPTGTFGLGRSGLFGDADEPNPT